MQLNPSTTYGASRVRQQSTVQFTYVVEETCITGFAVDAESITFLFLMHCHFWFQVHRSGVQIGNREITYRARTTPHIFIDLQALGH